MPIGNVASDSFYGNGATSSADLLISSEKGLLVLMSRDGASVDFGRQRL